MRNNAWLLCEFNLAKYPASLGTDIKRWSTRPRSRTGKFYEPRILNIGEITRSATDADGNWIVGSLQIDLDDSDGNIKTLLGTDATKFWTQREINVWVISQQGIDLGLFTSTVPPFFRGFVTNVQRSGRVAHVTAAEVLGSQMSGFNLDKKCLQYKIKDLNPSADQSVADLPLRILVGEFSDIGSLNAAGTSAAKGIVPAIEVGPAEGSTETFADPPVITASSVVGTTGQQLYYYAATIITPYGESTIGNIVALNGAFDDVRNLSNYNSISGTFDVGPDPTNPYKVRIWRGTTPDTMEGWLDEADYGAPGEFGYLDGAAHWPTPSRNELDDLKAMSPPLINGAQTNTAVFYDMFLSLAYGYEILEIEASNLAVNTDPKRTPITVEEHGETVITPDDPEWPHPDPWIVRNGIRFFGFKWRGPKLQHHRDKVVTCAVSMCGPHDADGKAFTQAFYGMEFLLNEHCLKNKGTGYRNDTYGTLETYADGSPMIQTSTATVCQDLTKEWVGELGYISAIWIDDPETTWRDVIRDFCVTFGARMYPNKYHQIAFLLIDTLPIDPGTGRHFRQKIEFLHEEDEVLQHELVANKYIGSFFWDLDAQEYRGNAIPVNDFDSQAAHVPGGVVGTPDQRGVKELIRECKFTNHQITFIDVANRELARRRQFGRYMPKIVPMLGMDYDIGYIGRVSTKTGLGPNGDVETPVIILSHTLIPLLQEVRLGFQDMSIMSGFSGAIGDETITDSSDEIGDEELVPPTAHEVGA
jgi:hypothetical protein